MKSALITGITGQDGFHLTKLLLDKNYKVYGLLNRQKNSNLDLFRAKFPEVILIQGDLTDFASLINAIDISSPNEVYNLGALSFVGLSFKQPELTANVTGLGPLRLLEAIRSFGDTAIKRVRVYQASSSEMFGKVREMPQRETTPFYPRSPYGVAKVYAHQICINYRESYGMNVSCGIMFNHEGEYRGEEFVTRKITKGVARIAKGVDKKIRLGTLEPRRDWGYAGDYVEAMWLMMQKEIPDEYVIATGLSYSVRDFLQSALNAVGLKGAPEDFVILDDVFKRPAEVDLLVGDASKAREKLGWSPKTTFQEMITVMIEKDLNEFKA